MARDGTEGMFTNAHEKRGCQGKQVAKLVKGHEDTPKLQGREHEDTPNAGRM